MTDAGVTSPVLQAQGFGLCFGTHLVLAGLDASLPANGVDVLMGPVRSGKSVWVRALAGRLQADSQCRQWGQVWMAGRPLADDWRPTLVQQQAQVSQADLLNALALPLRALRGPAVQAVPGAAEQALRLHGLAALTKNLSGPVSALTPSRQRAVNILGHALVGAPLLIVDEPTYGLADGEALWLVAWLAALGRRVRLLVVLQHPGHARRLADRIILLGGGRVLAHENAARFFSQPPNAFAEQFVRTGELTIAAPDANPEQLPPGVEEPPALPGSVWATLLAMRSQPGGHSSAPPNERLLRDFHTQPGELADSQLGDFSHSQRAELSPVRPASAAHLLTPKLPTPKLPLTPPRAPPEVPPRGAAPTPFAAHRLSSADFSDTIPGARLDMTPVMPPRAALGPQGLRRPMDDAPGPKPVFRAPPQQALRPGTDGDTKARAPAPKAVPGDNMGSGLSQAPVPFSRPPAALDVPGLPYFPAQRGVQKAAALPRASLPPVSEAGAQDAAAVGRVIVVDHQGLAGFHWLVPGKLAGCAQPGAVMSLHGDLDLLARAGIHTLITLTEQDLDPTILAQHGLNNLHLPIVDRQAPTIAQAYLLASRIQRLMDNGHTVAVHCKAGMGRTGVVLAAWMIRAGGYSAASALQRLRRVNSAYVQTQEQEAFLRAFEQDLLGRSP